MGAGFYTTFVWMAIYMKALADPPIEHSFWVNASSLLFGLIIPTPIAGMLSDYLGKFKVMVSGAIGLSIIGPIAMVIISKGSALDAFLAQCSIGICLALFGAPMNAWLVDMFPHKIRLTSAALGFDLASCTAAAFSPLIATLLVDQYGKVQFDFTHERCAFNDPSHLFVYCRSKSCWYNLYSVCLLCVWWYVSINKDYTR